MTLANIVYYTGEGIYVHAFVLLFAIYGGYKVGFQGRAYQLGGSVPGRLSPEVCGILGGIAVFVAIALTTRIVDTPPLDVGSILTYLEIRFA